MVGVIGLIGFVAGILAYQGKYKSWLVLKSFLFPGWPGLAGLYLGLAMMMFGLAAFLQVIDAPGIVMALWLVITAPSAVIGIIAMFWLPRFLWPQWLKDTENEMRRGEDRFSQAMKPGGALYGKLGRPRSEWPTETQDEWRRLQ